MISLLYSLRNLLYLEKISGFSLAFWIYSSLRRETKTSSSFLAAGFCFQLKLREAASLSRSDFAVKGVISSCLFAFLGV